MAERFGWTLDYIDSLTMQDERDYLEYQEISDGMRKGYDFLRRNGVKR